MFKIESKSGFRSIYGITFGLIIVIIFVYFFFFQGFFKNRNIEGGQLQAVFLENDQVYFGKLRLTGNFYVLTNVYYLQTEEEESQLGVTASDSVDITEINKQVSTKLVKLGNELHGPEDAMYIERSKVLFWENLKETSAIVQSISNYQSGN